MCLFLLKTPLVYSTVQVKMASNLEQNYIVLGHSDLNISVSRRVPQSSEPHSCG